MADKVKLSKDGTSIDFIVSENIPASVKKFRHSSEIEGLYRFIFENDLQKEAFEILDRIVGARKAKKLKEKQDAAPAKKIEAAAAKVEANKASAAAAKTILKPAAAAKATAAPVKAAAPAAKVAAGKVAPKAILKKADPKKVVTKKK